MDDRAATPDPQEETRLQDKVSQGKPSEGQPSQGEPSQGGSSQGEPSQTQPSQGDPSQGEPSQGEPSEGEKSSSSSELLPAAAPQNVGKALGKAPGKAEGRDAVLEGLSLRVDFRIGVATLPVQALMDLAPGFTITDLPGIIYPEIEAVCENRVFAKGELVEVDGRLGVRILQIME